MAEENCDNSTGQKRGMFILFEGIDRCGKTTQSSLLVDRLNECGKPTVALKFPDRETTIGKMIDSYLKNNSDLDDRCIHLLFSANRWEASAKIEELLREGKNIVCDRYAYSGVAFSAAKDGLSIEWCKSPDIGMPSPDLILFMDLEIEKATEREKFGEEKYEKADFQRKVRDNFFHLMELEKGNSNWIVIDASKSIEKISNDIFSAVNESLSNATNKPLRRL
eukprot:CAMPEP_0171474670 /NCGR_PEP_ID=MMETSP0946-20130122/2561_1 /TAXON_ID=109269 /ORGANISM="Vaucheria litorea, Strain CCMP2940" /LENGTH=221 /DNA_ID=CAMNT_0012004641 /DNA_START=11 /DNA_END=672 /DNA_ORIENTATION=-